LSGDIHSRILSRFASLFTVNIFEVVEICITRHQCAAVALGQQALQRSRYLQFMNHKNLQLRFEVVNTELTIDMLLLLLCQKHHRLFHGLQDG
jgi:hypothetical protein